MSDRSLRERRHPANAVGKTIAQVNLYGWRHEIIFTDGTKLQVEPGGIADAEAGEEWPPELIFQERLDADWVVLALDRLYADLEAELDQEAWRTPGKRTHREYEARLCLTALRELRHRLDNFENAVAEERR